MLHCAPSYHHFPRLHLQHFERDWNRGVGGGDGDKDFVEMCQRLGQHRLLLLPNPWPRLAWLGVDPPAPPDRGAPGPLAAPLCPLASMWWVPLVFLLSFDALLYDVISALQLFGSPPIKNTQLWNVRSRCTFVIGSSNFLCRFQYVMALSSIFFGPVHYVLPGKKKNKHHWYKTPIIFFYSENKSDSLNRPPNRYRPPPP